MQLRNHRGFSASQLLVAGLALTNSGLAIPVEDSPRQYLLAGLELPKKYSEKSKSPYTPGFRDPYDRAVDAVRWLRMVCAAWLDGVNVHVWLAIIKKRDDGKGPNLPYLYQAREERQRRHV